MKKIFCASLLVFSILSFNVSYALTLDQVNSIITLLTVFNVDKSVVDKVQGQLLASIPIKDAIITPLQTIQPIVITIPETPVQIQQDNTPVKTQPINPLAGSITTSIPKPSCTLTAKVSDNSNFTSTLTWTSENVSQGYLSSNYGHGRFGDISNNITTLYHWKDGITDVSQGATKIYESVSGGSYTGFSIEQGTGTIYTAHFTGQYGNIDCITPTLYPIN